ncbi:MAG: hypothetical protein NT126_12240 [Bacteroidetes bacterium]|nr:hypothetical protein [Bacteroidota bacterium]
MVANVEIKDEEKEKCVVKKNSEEVVAMSAASVFISCQDSLAQAA